MLAQASTDLGVESLVELIKIHRESPPPDSAEINDERRPAAADPGRLFRTWMKFADKAYGCFCHQLPIVTPNNGMYFGCASLLE